MELSYEQYQQMKKMLTKNPKLTLEQFAQQAVIDLDDITREPQVSESNAKLEQAMARGVQGQGDAGERQAPPSAPAKSNAKPAGRRQTTVR